MQEGMTDHQFDSIIKMVIKIIELNDNKQDTIEALKGLLKEKDK